MNIFDCQNFVSGNPKLIKIFNILSAVELMDENLWESDNHVDKTCIGIQVFIMFFH